jgi:hypothetical protein
MSLTTTYKRRTENNSPYGRESDLDAERSSSGMQIPPHSLILIQYVQQAKMIPNYKRNKIPDTIDCT